MPQGFYSIICLYVLVICCYGLTRDSDLSEKKSLDNSVLGKRKAIIHHHYTHNFPDDEFYYRRRSRRRCHPWRHRRPPHRYYSSYKRYDPYVNYHDNPITINNDENKHFFKLNEEGNRIFNSRQIFNTKNKIGQSIRHSFYNRSKLNNNNNNNKRFYHSSLNNNVDASINNGYNNITNSKRENKNENFLTLLMEYRKNYKSPHARIAGTFIPNLPNHYTNLRRIDSNISGSKINADYIRQQNNHRTVKTLPFFEQDPLDSMPSSFRPRIQPIFANYKNDYPMFEPTPGQIIYPPSVPQFKSIPKYFSDLKIVNNSYNNAFKQKSVTSFPLTNPGSNTSRIIYHKFYDHEAVTPRSIHIDTLNPMNNATIRSINRINSNENNSTNIKRNPLAFNNRLTEEIIIKTPYNASIKYITPEGYVFNSNSIKTTLSPVNYKFNNIKEDNNKPVYVESNKTVSFVAPPIIQGSVMTKTTIQPEMNQLGPTTVAPIFVPTRPMTFNGKRIQENLQNHHPDNRYVIFRTKPIRIDRNNTNTRLGNFERTNNSEVHAVKHKNITSFVTLGINSQPVYYVTPSSIELTQQKPTKLTSKRSGYKFITPKIPTNNLTTNNLIKNSTIYTLSNLLGDAELETTNNNINRLKHNRNDNNLINQRKRVLNHINYNRIPIIKSLATINKTQNSPLKHKSVNIKPNMMWIILPKITKPINNVSGSDTTGEYQNTKKLNGKTVVSH